MRRCVLFPQASGQQILEQERVSDARGPLRGHGARRSTDVGCLVGVGSLREGPRCQAVCWAGHGAAFIAEAPSGSGSPAPGCWRALICWSLPLPPCEMSRSTSGEPCPPGLPARRLWWGRAGDFWHLRGGEVSCVPGRSVWWHFWTRTS